MIPDIAFGKCPRCGRTGPDDPSPGSDMAPARDTVGNGYELELFRGEYLCPLCIKKIQDDDAALMERDKYAEDARVIAAIGFKKSVSS